MTQSLRPCDEGECKLAVPPEDVLDRTSVKKALAGMALILTVFGAVGVFTLRSFIREEIRAHDENSHAHSAATETFRIHMAREDVSTVERREILDRIGRIEQKVSFSSEALARLEERFARK
jgi:hypothetical protein